MLKKILLQVDTESTPSAFDSVVAFDSGVDQLLRFADVDELNVVEIVHGALFTRSPDQLRNTAIFVGGANVDVAERLLKKIQSTFFGPFCVSTLMDPGGANTTAVAALWALQKHLKIGIDLRVLVLGSTGPVGQRVSRLLAKLGARVLMSSRNLQRAQRAAEHIRAVVGNDAALEAIEFSAGEPLPVVLPGVDAIVAAGAAGVAFAGGELPADQSLKLAIDLNAVPPAGLGWIKPPDKGAERSGVVCYGAIGVGGFKMKLHRRAIEKLFESNDQVLDIDELYALAQTL